MCQLSKNSGSLNLLEPQELVQARNGIELPIAICSTACNSIYFYVHNKLAQLNTHDNGRQHRHKQE